MDLVLGTLVLRPYVFGFVACFLVAGALDLGWRRTLVTLSPFAFIAVRFLQGLRPVLYPSGPSTVNRSLKGERPPCGDNRSSLHICAGRPRRDEA